MPRLVRISLWNFSNEITTNILANLLIIYIFVLSKIIYTMPLDIVIFKQGKEKY